MHKALLILATAALLMTTAPATARLTAEPDRVIVAFHDWPGLQEGSTYMGERVVRVDEPLGFAVVEPRSPPLFEALARLDPNVRYLERDDPTYAVLNLVPNDPLYSNAGHYGSKIMGAETAWDRTLGTTAVKVAMIDTGIHRNHEEYAGSGRVLQGYDFANNDNDPADEGGACSYHGTHTTGTAGATINNGKGIAGMSQHTILPVKGLRVSLPLIIFCSGSTSALASALRYAGDQGAHVSSNSWGGGSASATLNSAITYAYHRGVTIVAAAGNDGACTDCVGEPWRSNPTTTVIVSCTTSTDSFCSFSSEGAQVDVSAPGNRIISTCGAATNAYCTLSGTSMSTPHVAGAAALVKALNPGFGYAQLDSRLKSTAKDLGPAGYDPRFGYGRVDAGAAVT